jgi:Flp pilus assembly protein TadB
MPEPETAPASAGPRGLSYVATAFAAIGLVAALVIALGLAAVAWVPLLLGAGVAMLTVWAARRRRQRFERRNADEMRYPPGAIVR